VHYHGLLVVNTVRRCAPTRSGPSCPAISNHDADVYLPRGMAWFSRAPGNRNILAFRCSGDSTADIASRAFPAGSKTHITCNLPSIHFNPSKVRIEAAGRGGGRAMSLTEQEVVGCHPYPPKPRECRTSAEDVIPDLYARKLIRKAHATRSGCANPQSMRRSSNLGRSHALSAEIRLWPNAVVQEIY